MLWISGEAGTYTKSVKAMPELNGFIFSNIQLVHFLKFLLAFWRKIVILHLVSEELYINRF